MPQGGESWGSGQKAAFSEYHQVAYQFKLDEELNNIIV